MGIADKSILRAAFITNKKEVIADMEEQNAQQAQQQQQQAQQQAQIDQSKIALTMASAQEKIAKIDDIHAGAEHKRSQADLDMVKTMIELEDMDLANFRSNLELAELIKMQNKASSESPQAQLQPAGAG